MQSPLEPYRDLLPAAPTFRALIAGLAALSYCLGQLADELESPGRPDAAPAGPEEAPDEFDLDDQAEMIGPTAGEWPAAAVDVRRLLNPRPLAR